MVKAAPCLRQQPAGPCAARDLSLQAMLFRLSDISTLEQQPPSGDER
jgi:hypothetical protein